MRKRVLPLLLSFAMVMGAFTSVDVSAAKKKVSLSSKKITINVGQTKTVKVKNTTKKVKWKILSGKKYISLTKKGIMVS